METRIGADRVEAERTLTLLARVLATADGRRGARVLAVDAARRAAQTGAGAGAPEWVAAQAAVCAFVTQLRADGVPPQRMLVDVKAVAHAATSGVLDVSTAQAVVEDVVRWSVEAFYR